MPALYDRRICTLSCRLRSLCTKNLRTHAQELKAHSMTLRRKHITPTNNHTCRHCRINHVTFDVVYVITRQVLFVLQTRHQTYTIAWRSVSKKPYDVHPFRRCKPPDARVKPVLHLGAPVAVDQILTSGSDNQNAISLVQREPGAATSVFLSITNNQRLLYN